MDLRLKDEMAAMPDPGRQLRRLRWFRATFRASARSVAAAYGYRFRIDDARLARAFFDWAEVMDRQKRFAALDRADFIVFAAGLALRELIRQNPAEASPPAAERPAPEAALAEIVRFWPEGFLYTNFCVAATAAVHEQEFGTTPAISACADDLRTWWSYRENATEMPAYAVAFLDRFLGAEPNWVLPDNARGRQAMQRALAAADADGIAGY
ncbi:MAG: hypothetical protein J0I98_17440 [Mesorhizobium sp.]|nr:hypothetical protein [Mesorhizobium sp.]MBN9244569.1 hypothetical protein [Mesorhizobium sp.]